MLIFLFNNQSIDVKVSANPNDCDMAIVPVDIFGNKNDTIREVIDLYGYERSIFDRIVLNKGFDLINGQKKSILFIVTYGNGLPSELIKKNLASAVDFYKEHLNGKTIWVPLMVSNSGDLSTKNNYEITLEILKQFLKNYPYNNTKFIIALPNTPLGLQIEKELIFENIDANDQTIEKILNSKVEFHLVGSNWENNDQSNRFYEEGIWENGYGTAKFGDRVNKINVGDVLLNKSTYAKSSGENYLRIKGIGIVTENIQDSTTIQCEWIYKNLNIDIKNLSHYRDTISQPSVKGLQTIIDNLNQEILSNILQSINDLKAKTSIVGVLNDAIDGQDYLNIKKDVDAFASVIAAKSFEPPLAIALFGKWGSGKSFFMRKLKGRIEQLSQHNPEQQFCQGIAHVHFNAWSYMDANLWASIVSRIFEGLNEYITNDNEAKENTDEINKQLSQNLTVTKEEIKELTTQKEKITSQIQTLEKEKNDSQELLKNNIKSIRKKTLIDIVEKVNKKFNVTEQIEDTLHNNPTFVKSKEEFEKIVPRKYWSNPEAFLKELNSINTFVHAFFKRAKLKTNILWVFTIIIILALTPLLTYLINLLLNWHDFRFTQLQLFKITVVGGFFVRFIDTYTKLKKQIAPFWEIKAKYDLKKENAIFKFELEQKAKQIEIEKCRDEILQINEQININKELVASIEFKIQNAISTETLYNFIEKRANSDDYKKHLGIISLIRKDFEILSDLLTGHQSELNSNNDSPTFNELFEKPLERIILYVDDLDRCPEDRVVEVLEAVNLLMAFPLFVVIVGVDPRWVKTALEKKYNKQLNGHDVSVSDYLEKIFQIPFHLKDADDNNVKFMIERIAGISPFFSSSTSMSQGDDSVIKPLKPEDEGTKDPETHLPIKTIRSKNLVASLKLSEAEINELKKFSKFIGNNPRAIKRYINIYKIIKSHDDSSSKNFEDFKIIMFLLALPLGHYKDFHKEIISEFELNNLKKFKEIFNSKTSYTYATDVKSIMIENNIDIGENKIQTLRENYYLIQRFSF